MPDYEHTRQSQKQGLQFHEPSKKDLSRILRTQSAIKAIEKKANSSKYNNLWPKAVLEALDDAIRNNQWETALKVCGFYIYNSISHTYAWVEVF